MMRAPVCRLVLTTLFWAASFGTSIQGTDGHVALAQEDSTQFSSQPGHEDENTGQSVVDETEGATENPSELPPAPIPPSAEGQGNTPRHEPVPPPYAPVVAPRLHHIPYYSGMAVPPGARIIERRRVGLIIAGAALFAVPYALSLVGTRNHRELAIPVLGPFLAMSETSTLARPFYVLDGLAQAAGVALLISGLVIRKRYLELWANDQQRLRWQPMLSAENAGLSFDLRF